MAFLSAYDPHEFSEARVRALATGRALPLAEIIATVRQNVAGPTLQHLIVSAPRGFGKSFLMRLAQFEIERIAREEGLPLAVVLMPEEMPHVKEPETLPRELARVLRGERGATAELTWHEDAGEAWEEAVADLAGALREKLGETGLLVAIVENFDALLRRAFGKEVQAARLREWLAAPDGRVMLLAASASGAFDRNYDDRLFQAFREIPLEPWSVDECMAFFDRQRREAGKPPLDPEAAARARAVASFIGGAPRLAVLLGDALFDDDVLRAAELLDRVQHELTPYYKDRVKALPGRSQKLLDALLRFGEPATQTELAARVNARAQTAIAEPFKDLVRERVVIGAKVEGSAEVRYRVADRIFAHYYRRRVVDHGAELCPLEAMVDLLADFYSPAQKAAKAGEFARAGRIAEARVMARLHDAETGGSKRGRGWILESLANYYIPRRLAPLATPSVSEALREIAALVRGRDVAEAYARVEAALSTSPQPDDRALLLLARSRLDAYEGVEGGLPDVEAARAARGDESGDAVGLEVQIAEAWALGQLGRHDDALAVGRRAADCAEMAGDGLRRAIAMRLAAYCLGQLGRHDEAVAAARRAADLAEAAGDGREQAIAMRHAAHSLGELGRHDEAVAAASRAADLAEAAGDVREQAIAMRLAAYSLGKLGRHDEAVAAARRAADLAEAAGDVREQAIAMRDAAYSLGQLGRHDEAVAAARRAADLAEAAGDVREQAIAMRYAAHSLGQLGRHDEAVAAARRAADLAEAAGDVREQAIAMRYAAHSLGELGRHDEAVAAERRAADLAEAAGDAAETAYAALELARVLADARRPQEALAPLAKAGALYAAHAGLDRAFLQTIHRHVATAAATQLAEEATTDGLTALLAAAEPFDATDTLRATFRSWMRIFITTALQKLTDPDRLRLWADAITLRFGDRFEEFDFWLRGAADYHESGRARRVSARLDPDFARTLELMFPPADR